MKVACLSILIVSFLSLRPTAALAQAGAPRPRIALVEGTAFLDEQPLNESMPLTLKEHSVVHTQDGRVEIVLPRAGALFLGTDTSVRLIPRPLNGGAFEILRGSAVVITGELGPSIVCEGEVQLSDSGIFRFNVRPVLDEKFCQVKVYKGAAAAPMPSFIWVLTSGKTLDLNRRCGDHIPRNSFDVEQVDAFDLWSRDHFTLAPQ